MVADSSAFDTLLRGSRSVGTPTREIWNALEVERRHVDPIEREEEEFGYHYIMLWGERPTIAEREYNVGRFKRVVKPPHSLSLGCAGRLPAVRALTPYDVTACIIKTKAVQELANEIDYKSSLALHEHLGVTDKPLTHLMSLVALETEAGGSSERLYRESLEQAVIMRFLKLSLADGVAPPSISTLPKVSLKRILDKLTNEYETDIALDDLAKEAGYSRSHFLKMFHQATGRTPFEYLRDIRLEAARHDLLHSKEGIAAIAAKVGFSSHSHLTRLFARKYGISPSAFRRNR